MGLMTDFMENKECDRLRGQGRPSYPANWYLALGNTASDSSFTELSGTGYARQAILRDVGSWTNTQNDGTTAASNGASHSSSNVAAVSWGNPGSAWGTATAVGLFDALTGGQCWMYIPIKTIVITTGSPNPVQLGATSMTFTLGLIGGCSDYLANKLIDDMLRGVAYNYPATIYFCLFTAAPTSAGGGTEVASYSRLSFVPSLASLSGTQASGSTSGSSGTSGVISNNNAVSHGTPGSWGTIVAGGVKDAASAGNLLWFGNLLAADGVTPAARSISTGDPAPTYAAGAIVFTLD